MSVKWIAIVIGSLFGAAFLGISIQMLVNSPLASSDNMTTSPLAKEVPTQLITGSSTKEPISNESAQQGAVPVLSSSTTPILEQPSP